MTRSTFSIQCFHPQCLEIASICQECVEVFEHADEFPEYDEQIEDLVVWYGCRYHICPAHRTGWEWGGNLIQDAVDMFQRRTGEKP